jgi:hypothetical protein
MWEFLIARSARQDESGRAQLVPDHPQLDPRIDLIGAPSNAPALVSQDREDNGEILVKVFLGVFWMVPAAETECPLFLG